MNNNKKWETPPEAHGGRRKTVALTATPIGTWLAQNTTLQPAADNQAPTTTEMQHDKTPWEAIWMENWKPPPDKQG